MDWKRDMPAIINDPDFLKSVLRRRRGLGLDRYDEVWNGVHVMNAMPNNEHQLLVLRLSFVLETLIGDPGLGKVLPGANVSDRQSGWKKNYRCPDVLVFLAGNPATDCGDFWHGGPDLAVEILSPNDRSRQKLPFYAAIGTREVLLIDRHPWRLEHYRLKAQELRLDSQHEPGNSSHISLQTAPLDLSLLPGTPRPQLVMTHRDDARVWTA